MVKKINKSDKAYFECEECSFVYEYRKIAEKCENYCRKYHSCDMEITKHAIKI